MNVATHRRRTATADATPTVLRRRPGLAELQPGRYQRRRRLIDTALAWGVPIILIGLWELGADRGVFRVQFFPAPSSIVAEAVSLVRSGELQSNLAISLERVAIGLALGVASGAIVGLVMGMSHLVRAALDPLLSALYTVPKLALLPVFLLIFGLGEVPIDLSIAVSVFFFMWISTMEAILAVGESYREVASSFGASRWQMFRHVLLPAALPGMMVALQLSAGVSVLVMVGVEFVMGSDGIGNMIWLSWSLFLATKMYVGIVVVAVVGLVMIRLVRLLTRFVVPWASTNSARGI
ncbi:MAG TPA: ABC transporter permease [Candidatus Dormibacteraeota bacterium]|jgi:NitT/TauT family transport system permease protein/sulfonate transport system permease protein|nr:ABC transporter permease [Candidatus Dormibacteraeota bacterium]